MTLYTKPFHIRASPDFFHCRISYNSSTDILVVQPGGEGAGFPLVVPALRPAGRAERAVGKVELQLMLDSGDSLGLTFAVFRTWRQGLKSSPFALMHLW